MRYLYLFLALAFLWPWSASAQEAAYDSNPIRWALVIGNNDYRGLPALTSAQADADLVAAALVKAKFRTIVRKNLTVADLRRELQSFRATARGSEVSLIYFAGHGFQAQASNWFAGIDSKIDGSTPVSVQAVPLSEFEAAVDGGQRLRALFLDACRESFLGAPGSEARAGLSSVERDEMFIMFAAAEGEVAYDGVAGGNSPFAQSIARWVPEVGLDVRLLGGRIRDSVQAATRDNARGMQRPFLRASLSGVPFSFIDGATASLPRPLSAETIGRALPNNAFLPLPLKATSDGARAAGGRGSLQAEQRPRLNLH